MSCAAAQWFLGSASSTGYLSGFGELASSGEYHCTIIKGAPGRSTGTLLREVARRFEDTEERMEEFRCSLEPEQLDAVVLHGARTVLVDGSPPHAFEPLFPGAVHSVISMEDCWDIPRLLATKKEILIGYQESSRAQERARRFLSAFASLNADTCTLALEGLNRRKLSAFATRFCHRLSPRRGNEPGSVTRRQLSAVTPLGYETILEALEPYENVYILSDAVFAGADALLTELTACAVQRGLDVIVSENPLFQGKMQEHLLLPQIGTALLTSNPINRVSLERARTINCGRFFEKTVLARRKQRIAFNKKAGMELFSEAALSFRHAAEARSALGRRYDAATDSMKLQAKADALCATIRSRMK